MHQKFVIIGNAISFKNFVLTQKMQLPGTHPPEMTKMPYEKWLHNNKYIIDTQIAICL